MILWIFITFFSLIIALLFLSYFYDSISDAPINFIKLFSWAFMFLFAVSCLTSGIEYKTGEIIIKENICNCSAEQRENIYTTTETITDVYTTYTNTTGFILLAIMSALAFGMVLYYTRGV